MIVTPEVLLCFPTGGYPRPYWAEAERPTSCHAVVPSDTQNTEMDLPVVGAAVPVARNCGVAKVIVAVPGPEAVMMVTHCWPGFPEGVGVERVHVEEVVELALICV